MNTLYAKCFLYAYTNLEDLCAQIDEIVLKRALSSISDTSPAFEQYQRILDYTEQKKLYINVKLIVSEALKSFTQDEINCIEYKYFMNKQIKKGNDFDTSSRAYFRRQSKLAEKFASVLEGMGINDDFYVNTCMKTNFFREMVRRVKEYEALSFKNKGRRRPHTVSLGCNYFANQKNTSKKRSSQAIA